MLFPQKSILLDVRTRRVLDNPSELIFELADYIDGQPFRPFVLSQDDAEEMVIKLLIALRSLGNTKAGFVLEECFGV